MCSIATVANICSSREAAVEAVLLDDSMRADLLCAFKNAADVGTAADYTPLATEGKRGISALLRLFE